VRIELMQSRAEAESPEFGRYAAYILEEFPDLSMPMLRQLFHHNASASEYRASLERVRKGGMP